MDPSDVSKKGLSLPLEEWSTTEFLNECRKVGITAPPTSSSPLTVIKPEHPRPLQMHRPETNILRQGTFKGSQKALTSMYQAIQNRFQTYFDLMGFDPVIPTKSTLQEKRATFTWSRYDKKTDPFPPHLALVPAKSLFERFVNFVTQGISFLQIFSFLRLLSVGPLLGKVVPENIVDFFYGRPDAGATIQDVVDRNAELRKSGEGLFASPNIGDRQDVWYTDACFAQQNLTGVNPTTLKLVSESLLTAFEQRAHQQGLLDIVDILLKKASDSDANDRFYVQDHHNFKEALNLPLNHVISSEDSTRSLPASIALFRLTATGTLHPLAVCIDWKGSLDDSVVIFNKRLRHTDSNIDQATDWPWRYAKTCAQVSDWMNHEASVHLVRTHFVEEATIVAANRAFPEDHIIYRLLSPHWFRTLPLNAAARSSLVPFVVVPLSGCSEENVYKYCMYAYEKFDWTGMYVPNDLANRGFPIDQLQNDQYHNCAWAKDILLFWNVIHKFIKAILEKEYADNEAVIKDITIQRWSAEMRDPQGGAMQTFPVIKTREELIDCITACIHIASPQHSSINYLQQYYLSFVLNRPSCLCTAPPDSLEILQGYQEQDLMEALPINAPRTWLLASHVPYLLSYSVEPAQNLVTYAASCHNIALQHGEAQKHIAEASKTFYSDLRNLEAVFKENSDALDDKGNPYSVLSPPRVAVSILL